MWIVRLALRRPLSVAVMALLMLVLGTLSFSLMNVDIFPEINLPVVMVVWSYPGLAAIDVERRMVFISERAYSTTVNDIEHIESESINGLGILKIYFHQESNIGAAIAQINAVSETILSNLPRGIQPPQIISYNASNVPIAQLNVYSDTLSTGKLFDYGLNFIRIQLFTIPGFSSPAPLGGVSRSVMVNLDPTLLYAHGLSASDIGNTLATSNVVIPSGTAKIGNYEYDVDLNMSFPKVSDFNQIPVKWSAGSPVLLGDIAPVTDTHQPQTNVVRVDGKPATYLMVIKHADASTLNVIDAVKAKIPLIRSTAPKGLNVALTFDQSKFVRAALTEVVREAGIAAFLVAIMVLVFLGSPRSMLIVITSIPLAILTAIIGLKLSGQTINTMTLGGIALAVGMLVDDATVEVENIHRNHAMHKPLLVAILDGATQIATPTFVGTISICIVFFPVVLLTGVARFLFTPLALAVVFAMLTSYLLSRTLVPTMARYLLPDTHEEHVGAGRFGDFVRWFDGRFERLRDRYKAALGAFIARRGFSLTCVALIILLSLSLLLIVGEDFFPSVDAGMMRLHVRAPSGTRIEHTEYLVENVEETIRTIIPPSELDSISDNIGLPLSYDLAFYQTDSTGPQDCDVAIQLKPNHRPTRMYQEKIRTALAEKYPNITAYFQAADITSQILNFGLSAAIDAQITGNNLQANYQLALKLKEKMAVIPGVRDLRIAEPLDYPALKVDTDRTKALQTGITQQQIASSMLAHLSGAALLQPNFWLDPVNGVNYGVIAQSPQHLFNSISAIQNLPLSVPSQVVASSGTGAASSGAAGASTSESGQSTQPQLLGNLATIHHAWNPSIVAHYTVQRAIDVDCSVSGRDLGGVSAQVGKAIASLGELPPGTAISILGQSKAMRESFTTLGEGLILAIVLVYLLMVANFQSWLEPFIITMAVPGALAGVLWMLVLTGTTINVESLMGAIMAVGVGVANGNLLITFANEMREEGYSPVAAAIEAGHIRLRPIIMTALAMILGMLPMALSLGEGSEQNAPLGRAVIGGLFAATLMTLFVVPAVYSLFSRHLIGKHQRDAEIEAIGLPGA
ncbi:MAG TPA: efflux RND transporter permease subunit [Candidatus Binataceae bacterium]|nr:efflux RND transporter permease subunit [Candidatus Binataceae bacterium]